MLSQQNIYRKDHKENIRIFRDLKTIKEFSSYSNDLNRIFGENSYNHFHKNLNQPKQIIGDNYIRMFQKSDKNIKFKIFEDHFNLKQFKVSLKNMKIKDRILNYKIKNPYLERMKQSNNYLLKKDSEKHTTIKSSKSLFPSVPDVGHYNPKYHSINKHSYRAFFGNVPTNRFYTIDQEIVKTDVDNSEKKSTIENGESRYKLITRSNILKKNTNMNLSNLFSLKHIIGNNSKIQSAKKNLPINNIQNMYNIKDNKSEKVLILKSRNNNNISNISHSSSNISINNSPKKTNISTSIDVDSNVSFINNKKDNNHCLRFETYTCRKPLNKTIIYNTDIKTELPNYYSPKYIKNYINFNKNTASYLDQIIHKEQNPPLGFYEPKYSLIFNNIDKNVYINKNSLLNCSNNVKSKIFCNYNVSTDYITVPSLNIANDENEKIDNTENNDNDKKQQSNDDIKNNNN